MDCGELIGIISERPRNFAWLLGAGASRSAGLPTATDVLWDLKRRYYCRSENQDISQQDVQNRAVREKIQSFMASKGFPEPWADNEYTAYFERIFGDDRERQNAYLQKILSEDRVSLSVGNRALGALVAMSEARAVFTTNFDTVLEKAVAEVSGRPLAAFHIEGSYAANDALSNEQYPIYCKLHGDFRYQSVKNLSADLKAQDDELDKCLVNACNRFGLIVTGYSGRDASVLALLKGVLTERTPERPAEQVYFAEAVQISVEEKNGRIWLVLTPDIWVWPKTARPLATEFLDTRRKDRLNEKADQLLSAWCQVLLGTADHNTAVNLSPFASGDTDENPVFTIGTRTAYSRML